MSRRYSKRRAPVKRTASQRFRRKILDYLRRDSVRPCTAEELAESLGIGKGDRGPFTRNLNSLVRSGEVTRIRGGRYAATGRVHLVTGTWAITREGWGRVVPSEGEAELSIPPSDLKGAMHGDRVVARPEKRPDARFASGRIVRILERAHRDVVAYLHRHSGILYASPYDSRLTGQIIIPEGKERGAGPGQLAVVTISEYPSGGRPATGEVAEILGKQDDPRTETQAVIHTHGLPHRFPEAVTRQALSFPAEERGRSLRNREDLRELPFVTIDGARARDFDDALYAVEGSGGNITLMVSIADVSHFVRPGSALDKEALRRGNSVYFPDAVLPMLPERLSNELCSLNPDQDRLSFTCEVEVDRTGEPIGHRLFTSVIRSSARLTYREVEDYFTDGSGLEDRDRTVLANLHVLRGLKDRLMARRKKRYSLDFDLPEPEVVLDCMGQVENIYRAERYSSHRLVEECMLLANEVVAKTLRETAGEGIYRVHQPPDAERLDDLNRVLSAMGTPVTLSKRSSPKPFLKILEQARQTKKERFLNMVILRSMMRAEYSPQPHGHFGLALKDYTHFTSPIRRYADLLVHRLIKSRLGLTRPYAIGDADQVCRHISDTERTAETAERDILASYRARFMAQRIGDEFTGIISAITSFGFFVELDEYYVEGLVRLSGMTDDFYIFDDRTISLIGEHTGRIFRIGDRVTILVARVDPARRHIDFELLENR